MLLTEDGAGTAGVDSPEALRLDGISKAYPGIVALDNVSLALRSGEVHALVGENGAGKSTLMGVLYGLVRADEGRLIKDGRAVTVTSPRHARELGIGLVQQHFSLIPTLSAAQNLMLALRGTGKARTLEEARRLVKSLGEKYGLTVAPDAPVESLPISQQQRTEILKALAVDARILALDEPNALLTPDEWKQLADILRVLADEGVAVALISHKLDDVMALADCVTVLRRGRVVTTTTTAETDAAQLGAFMVGELISLKEAPDDHASAEPHEMEPVLEVRDLSVAATGSPASVKNVSLTVRRGEIVGLAGVEGSGQVELTEALAGMRTATEGTVVLAGSDLTGLGVNARRRRGVACIPADRHTVGMFGALSVAENMLLPRLRERPLSSMGFLSKKRMRARAEELIAEFDIRVANCDVPAGTLSGGNQQKMVLARELSRDPALLVCCYATRGLDFAAANAVREKVRHASQNGAAVLYASVDLDELIEIADRILVMHAGEIVGEVTRAEADPDVLGALMGGRRAA